MRKLDRTDIGILNRLQENARITNAELARAVNLSSTPCFNRVKAMEELGLIRQQVTLLAPELLGLHVNVFIHVSLEKQVVDALARFESAIAERPEVMFVDDLLRPEALERLRRFCWESTIWKKDYENGYIGAFLGDGFATPLLLQIADELRKTFPGIFGSHPLTQAWAFKHDSARRGLNIHADAAAVNVNFWITADDANLSPASGGLIVWNKEAPREWNFKDYNSAVNRGKIYDWLKQVGASEVKIPYRSNRAVIFNSDLFHETDEISFKEGYTNRRINITLLYGYRHRE